MSDQVLEFVLASPEVILVTTPEPSSLTDSYSLMKAMCKNPKYLKDGTNVHLVANKVNSEAEGKAVYEKIRSVVQKFLGGDLDYLGYVLYDSQLEKAVRNQKVVSLEYPTARATKNFEQIASKLIKQDDQAHFKWGISNIFNSLLRDRA